MDHRASIPENDRWMDVLSVLVGDQELLAEDNKIRQRTSGAFVLRCVFHSERTPSLFLYPNDTYTCYGCGRSGDSQEFIDELVIGKPDYIVESLANAINSIRQVPGQMSINI